MPKSRLTIKTWRRKMNRNKKRVLLFGGVTLIVIAAFGFYMIPKAAAATGCFPDTVGHWAEEFISGW